MNIISPSIQDICGDTPLIVACEWGQLLAVTRLIELKANIDYENKASVT